MARLLKFLPYDTVVDSPSDVAPPLRSTAAPRISPLASVDPRAKVGDECEIGPFCVVGPDVVMGRGNKLLSHVVVTGHTTIGVDNTFYPHAVIGCDPQDKKFRGELSRLEVGDRNSVRESVTMHTGTTGGGGLTRVGNDNLLMVNAHVSHDCHVGNHCILGNNVMLAGHTFIQDYVNMSGGSGTNHYVTVGQFAFVAALSKLHYDVPPFVRVSDDDMVRDVNLVGLRRAGVPAADLEEIERVARQLFFTRKNKRPVSVVLAELEATPDLNPRVRDLVEFLRRRDKGKSGRYLESLRPKQPQTPAA